MYMVLANPKNTLKPSYDCVFLLCVRIRMPISCACAGRVHDRYLTY